MEQIQNMFPHFFHIVERKCTPAWRIREGVFEQYNLILIYEGEAFFTSNKSEFKGTRGSLIYFKPGDYRLAYTNKDKLMSCFAVDFLYTCPSLDENGWKLHTPELPLEPIQKILDPFLFNQLMELFGQLTRTWLSEREDKLVHCRNIFSNIISLLLLTKDKSHIEFSKYRTVEKVIGYMTENYSNRISLENLAEYAQISPSYLGSIFREVTGKPPIEYLIGIRLRKAKELLKDGYTVSETAQKLGFNDVYYFSKCFKKHEGVVPSRHKT